MKALTITIISAVAIFFSFAAHADQAKKDRTLHEIHAMMRMMDNALCQALEGANLLMFGQMSGVEKIDEEMIERGTSMVKEGKAVILKMLAGSEMKAMHKEGGYNVKVMQDLHELGDRMLHVIEEVENLHADALKHAAGK